MERLITVYNTRDQRNYTFNSTAETLGQLKQDFQAHNIDYADLDIIEGITKITLLSDDSQLPSNIEYRGNRTNDLVILLTNTSKKIKSGTSRSELYAKLTDDMKADIKETYGRNFTQVSSDVLETVIASYTNNIPGADNNIDETHEDYNNELEVPAAPQKKECCKKAHNACTAILYLAHYLNTNGLICKGMVNKLKEIIEHGATIPEEPEKPEEEYIPSPYSDEEISDMLEDLGL